MIVSADNLNRVCARSDEIAQFLDGELSPADEILFETHLADCPICAKQLNAQKRLLCALDSAFEAEKRFELPADFMQNIVVRAESNVSGLRSVDERRRAFVIVAGLFLLGAAAGFVGKKSGVLPDFVRQILVVGGVLANFCYDFGLALVITARGVARIFAGNSPLLAFFSIVLLVVSLLALARLLRGNSRLET